jgi:hypothetical protein
MSRTLDAVDSLISRVAASSTMPFASGKSSKFTLAGSSKLQNVEDVSIYDVYQATVVSC